MINLLLHFATSSISDETQIKKMIKAIYSIILFVVLQSGEQLLLGAISEAMTEHEQHKIISLITKKMLSTFPYN